MQNSTDEFSFLLKPAQHGIGVFAVHGIKQGVHLRLSGYEEPLTTESLMRDKKDVPEIFRQYCIDRGYQLMCPKDFASIPLEWFLNHSKTPNATRDADYRWYASRDIKAGEEITIDYNSLEEPEGAKQDFYRN